MYHNCKVYGPYKRSDGYSHVIIIFSDGKRKTVSYAKYLVEISIGRYLGKYEEVHHKDKNPENNSLENLQIIQRTEHKKLHMTKYFGGYYNCCYCGKRFHMTPKQESNRARNNRRGINGPFCSRKCSGKYGTDIQSANRETD